MDLPVRCQCGRVQGVLHHAEHATSAICYCKDCQAYAAWLDKDGKQLDAQGGTHVLAVHPQQLAISQGMDAVACMSLSDQGILRWYAACCNSPVGNTPRNMKMAYVGLFESFVAQSRQEIEQVCGPVQLVSAPESARGTVAGSGWRAAKPILGIMRSMVAARLTGSYRRTPFFTADATPVKLPTVLTPVERAALNS